MKKRFIFLIITVIISFSLMSVACTPPDDTHTCVDANGDGVCDVCGDPTGVPDDPDNPDDPDDPSGEKNVKSIAVKTKPKAEYVIGDKFTVEGGTITVTYDDGNTEEIPMSDRRLKITAPGLSTSGTKQVKIEYGKESCRYTVKVVNKQFSVIFDANYESAEATTKSVLKGKTVAAPRVVRSGHTLFGWFTDPDYTEKFDFETPITKDMTLYALWKQDGKTYFDVTFSYDFYGARITEYSYPVIAGGKIDKPSAAPVRPGYRFDGWLNADGNGFDFDASLTGNITVTAGWTKTVTGSHDYIFEAEDTDLTGKSGPALSGQAVETGMIVKIADRNASNDRCVSYLYAKDIFLDFDFASDIEVADAAVYISLSAEYRDYTFSPANYGVYLNGTAIEYDAISFVNVPPADDNYVDCLNFKYYQMGVRLTLKKGANKLRLVTMNSDPMQGTTLTAAAPVVDAVKINTSAVLMWDESKGLPCGNY